MWQPRGAFAEPGLTWHVAGGGTPDVLLTLGGMLSGDDASLRFERSVERQAEISTVRRIHLDLHELEAIDLEGIAVLVHAYRESSRKGTALTLEGATGPVRRRLLTTGILRIMEPPGTTATAS